MTYSLHLSHEIFVPREIVWDLWTQPEHLGEWYSPSAPSRRQASVDLRVGGSYALSWTGADGVTYTEHGEFIEVEPPQRLVYTMEFDEAFGQPASTELTVDFVDVGGTTRIEIEHRGYPDEQMRDQHAQGWPEFLKQLEEYLSAI